MRAVFRKGSCLYRKKTIEKKKTPEANLELPPAYPHICTDICTHIHVNMNIHMNTHLLILQIIKMIPLHIFKFYLGKAMSISIECHLNIIQKIIQFSLQTNRRNVYVLEKTNY